MKIFSCAVADHSDLADVHRSSRLGEQFSEFRDADASGATLLIDGATEGWSFSEKIAEGLHRILEELSIAPARVLVVTTNHLFTEDYRAWCNSRNVAPVNLFIYDYWAYKIAAELVDQAGSLEQALMQPIPEPKVSSKLLTYNRVFKAHRAAVVLQLQRNGELASSHASFMPDARPLPSDEQERMGSYLASLGWPSLTDLMPEWPELARKVPLTADRTAEDEYLSYVFGTILADIYAHVGFAVITESDFGVGRVDRVTEKPFKAIANRCPFVLVGQAGQLARLSSLGLIMGEMADPSYDTIACADKRLATCLRLIDELSRKSLVQLEEDRRRQADTLDANFRTLVELASQVSMGRLADKLAEALP
ncbi:hypothetical protein [Sphingomonas natans]|uniref:hypothetical protein n=1 Tax=Sphingomonas natans TaxID=3063330 RepID=UPI0026E270B1|nr:hypothetical protein [Sphingomonas sp. BIUV-7]